MDVVCGRCRAEYEFDDALISERGTTVRCTNCGLQFKVFPPVGQRVPEVWLVFDPHDRRVEPVRYDTLRDMQKAIARGDVTAEHLLSRGEEEPRPLRDIVELQPLLHQPHSEPPPPPDSSPAHAKPVAPAGVKTVLGIQQRPNPVVAVGGPPPPSARDEEEAAEAEIVPGEHAEPEEPTFPAREAASKPKIRSALSMSPPTQAVLRKMAQDMAPESTGVRPSMPAPQKSLRSTLSGAPPASRPSSEAPPSSSRQNVEDADLEERISPPPVEESPRAATAPPSLPVSARLTPPMDPMISDPDEYAGQMTPTPGALRAYRTPDADPASSVAGVHVKQRAKTGGIVLAVLLGGALFLAFANRERISGVLSESRGAKVESEQTTIAVVPQDLALRIQMADAAWISSSLLKSEESKLSAVETQTIEALEHELGTAGTGASWEHVNLLRMKGQLKDARTMAKELQKGPEQSYALSMLDLAEAEDNPPWPVVIERLRESSTGERGRFLARSAYIYALGASGAVARARADFEALEQVAGAKDAPLFDELKAYLARLGAFEATAEGPTDSGEPSAETTSEETTAETADEDLEDPDATKDTGGEVSEKVKKQPKVSEAIKSQVAQADAMWRGGNQEGALAIYRKVVAEIGTEHFLGQRAAARIAQAAREKAAAQ